MSKETKTLSTRVDGETKTEVELYQVRHGLDNESETVRKLVTIGLRESRGPVLYRLRGAAIDMVWHLCFVCVAIISIGYGTDVLPRVRSLGIAAVLLVAGIAVLAAVELVRIVRGEGTIGWRLRQLWN